MDPLTHGIIGLGVAALSGETELMSPITIGAIIGAMSPDIDIIAKYWGDYKYLKHHRGATHSLFSILGLSIVISLILNFIFPDYSFVKILASTSIGTLSHTFFDALNSYGVKPLLPFKNKKYLASLLMLYDPFLSLLSIGLFILKIGTGYKIVIALAGLSVYIAYRHFIKRESTNKIIDAYGLKPEDRLHVMPNLTNFFKWDFVFEKSDVRVVGRISFLSNKIDEIERLDREESELIAKAYSTELGKYFDEFTSSINHVEILKKNNEIELKFIDLRYHMKNSFMHHATFIYDKDDNLKKSIFRPYKYEKQILIEGNPGDSLT